MSTTPVSDRTLLRGWKERCRHAYEELARIDAQRYGGIFLEAQLLACESKSLRGMLKFFALQAERTLETKRRLVGDKTLTTVPPSPGDSRP